MRQLTICCDGGFGNRFNALVTGLALARRLGCSPQVLWPVNNWCGASFDALLRLDNIPVLDWSIPSLKDRLAGQWPAPLFLLHEDQIGLGDVPWLPMTRATWQQVTEAAARDVQAPIVFHTALVPPALQGPDLADAARRIDFAHGIKTEVARTMANWHPSGLPSPLVGLHVRKTDFGWMSVNDELLWRFVKRHPGCGFFVCSDDAQVEARFATLPQVRVYAKQAWVEKHVAGDWNQPICDDVGRTFDFNVQRSALSVQQAVVDMLLLSHTQIAPTSSSTFLAVARLLQELRGPQQQPAPVPWLLRQELALRLRWDQWRQRRRRKAGATDGRAKESPSTDSSQTASGDRNANTPSSRNGQRP